MKLFLFFDFAREHCFSIFISFSSSWLTGKICAVLYYPLFGFWLFHWFCFVQIPLWLQELNVEKWFFRMIKFPFFTSRSGQITFPFILTFQYSERHTAVERLWVPGTIPLSFQFFEMQSKQWTDYMTVPKWYRFSHEFFCLSVCPSYKFNENRIFLSFFSFSWNHSWIISSDNKWWTRNSKLYIFSNLFDSILFQFVIPPTKICKRNNVSNPLKC